MVTVTSRGVPVATLAPAERDGRDSGAAKRALLDRLRGRVCAGATWTRDELYD